MTIELKKTYTADEFMDLPDDGYRYELVEGELLQMSQPGDEHGTITSDLFFEISLFVRENKLGKVYSATGFKIAERTVRAPDVAFVQTSRVQPVTRKAVLVAPDLAVEVVSPNDEKADINDKLIEYQEAGVRLIWWIYPESKVVLVYHLADGLMPQPLGIENELDGKDVLPGFKLRVSDLFKQSELA